MKIKLPKVNFRFLPFLLFSLLFLGLGIFLGKYLPDLLKKTTVLEQKLIKEESAVIEIAEKSSPSVVTVSIKTPQRQILEFSPFGGLRRRTEGGEEQDIGSGFIVSNDGLIITNKHVVNSNATYKVITSDDKEYEVKSKSLDPNNDIAILKIDANDLKPLELGMSSNLKVGQFVVAIGTALGEFRHTVTTGVVSGLGRGIVAGSVFEGYVEKLDDVIQTDAAINPGNSGGPLINSAGQVIGVNVAVAQGAENIGFAIPIDVVKKSLDEFKSSGGKFVGRAYLGVRYEMIGLGTALLNDVPQGAYVVEVVSGSPADKSGVLEEDIITKIDGLRINEKDDIGEVIRKKKVGDKISLEVYRNGETLTLEATLSEFTE
jgi:serine protease Do